MALGEVFREAVAVSEAEVLEVEGVLAASEAAVRVVAVLEEVGNLHHATLRRKTETGRLHLSHPCGHLHRIAGFLQSHLSEILYMESIWALHV